MLLLHSFCDFPHGDEIAATPPRKNVRTPPPLHPAEEGSLRVGYRTASVKSIHKQNLQGNGDVSGGWEAETRGEVVAGGEVMGYSWSLEGGRRGFIQQPWPGRPGWRKLTLIEEQSGDVCRTPLCVLVFWIRVQMSGVEVRFGWGIVDGSWVKK